jgi:hypothetical protein
LFIVIVGVLIADAIEGFIRMTWFRGGVDTVAANAAKVAMPLPPVLPQASKKNEPFGGKNKDMGEGDDVSEDEDMVNGESKQKYKKKDENKMGYKRPTMSPRPSKYS